MATSSTIELRPKDELILQTKDGSQCVTWTNSQLTYMGRDAKEIPVVLCRVYGRFALRLDLSFCSLVSLKGLEAFVVVTEVILDNNSLSDDVTFPFMPHVRTLSLNKNNFRRFPSLLDKIKRSFPNLTFLSLLGNYACPSQFTDDESEYKEYRKTIVAVFPHLKFLDSNKVTQDDKERRVPVVRLASHVVRPRDEEMVRFDESDDGITEVGTAMSVGDVDHHPAHSTAYGKVKYRYTGKHSEGNRFIRNNQL